MCVCACVCVRARLYACARERGRKRGEREREMYGLTKACFLDWMAEASIADQLALFQPGQVK